MFVLDAQFMAMNLMMKHGLIAQGWTFQITSRRGVIMCGRCYHDRRKITLTEGHVSRHELKDVRDTILHEIAHALVGHQVGHGWEWKRKCVEIGAIPERLYRDLTEGEYDDQQRKVGG